ncbi:MAG: hypothetical protein ACHQYP_10355, partial [Nitrospiria bacterium]
GYFDYQGVIHFHTNYSGDATGSFEQIARVSNKEKIDFMVSTDHNTLQPLYDKKEGWYENTLFLTGEEISLNEGYLLALDIRQLNRLPDENTEMIVKDIVDQGGILFIAHPNHPRWKWNSTNETGFIGQEILDFADQWYTAGTPDLLTGIVYYPLNSSAGFLQLYKRPNDTLRDWDRRTLRRNFVGIFAPDFHQAIKISRNFKIPFPGADKVLPIAHDHIVLKSPFTRNFSEDKKSLYDAIRRGHLYISMDILGNASGFFFSATQENTLAWMGDQLPAGIQTNFSVKLPQSADGRKTLLRVFHNGTLISSTVEKEYNFQSSDEGAYRIEVETTVPTFWGSERNVVWIYSNPIYLR